ncbi:MAG: NADPH-dependent glutamate synthase [Christensenellaceae bacterium]|jgi:glutamate synthase (NADPH/NADH) small chain|nr:NADPH-dependent glutamate synthase [Christensenellaceae bacterium]
MKINRYREKSLSADFRKTVFDEVAFTYDEDIAVKEASRCLNCKSRPCVSGCPVNVDIPKFIHLICEHNFFDALNVIKETNQLPAVCGRVCPQEQQCEKYCVHRKAGNSIAIGSLERFVADFSRTNVTENQIIHPAIKRKEAIAVIGSGPASLTCAVDCAIAGFNVIVFEALHELGGVLVFGIPEFRLPKNIVHFEIERLEKYGVEFKLNAVIGKTITFEQLRANFDAVFIGTGAGLPRFMDIPGESLNGVYSANEYLTRVNLMKAYLPESDTPIQKANNVVVFGAGNVALDASRTALRLGAKNVTVVYRRSRNEMPARAEEVRHAEEEGVIFKFLSMPVELLSDDYGSINSVRCISCVLSDPGTDGRRISVPLANSDFEIKCDMAIIAIGTDPNPIVKKHFTGLATNARGMIITDENAATNLSGVYAGGDAVTGVATVILAMGAGKTAALSISKYLKAK